MLSLIHISEPTRPERISYAVFCLTSFFGFYAWIGPRGIYEADDWKIEFLSRLHESEGLAIAFGIGHAKIPILPHLGVDAFLMTDHNHGLVSEFC